MKKIAVVTGGAGFIGSHLCEKLHKEGYQVLSLDNYFTGTTENHIQGVTYRKGHTRDIARHIHETPSVVYHLGEYSRVEKSFEDPLAVVWDLNIAGTFAVLEFCRKHKAKLVYAGSSTKFSSDENGSNQSPYAWSKSANTTFVKNYGDWYGLSYAITYFYNVYGPRHIKDGPYATVIGIFERQREQGLPLTVVRPGSYVRNYTHVDDIVDGLMLVGEQGEGDEYGIGSDESFSVQEVASLFETNVVMMPERRGNRSGAEVLTQKTRALGWSATRHLRDYIASLPRHTNPINEPRILVFATTFYPCEGLPERTLRQLAIDVPDVQFDVVTTALGHDEKLCESLPKNIHLYRVGTGTNPLADKLSLVFKTHTLVGELTRKHVYTFVWSLMATYGTVPAYFAKKKLGIPLLVSLGDQRMPLPFSPKRLLLEILLRSGDQVSTNAALLSEATRTSAPDWILSLSKKGDAFTNAFRFAYSMEFTKVHAEYL